PASLALLQAAVEFGESRAGGAGIAPHVVQREQPRVTVKGGILDALGCRRPGELLPAHDEAQPGRALVGGQAGRPREREPAAQELAGGAEGGPWPDGRGRRAFDPLAIGWGDRLTAHVGAVHGQAGGHLDDRRLELDEGYVASVALVRGELAQP